ncbi:MAG: hypothetical protein FWC82_01475, partial [Firmicutes bacterium]|nr:hypothetical protein [Bacillota bacterium]
RLAQKEYAKEKLKRTFPQLTNKAIDKYQKFLQELNDNIILRACMLSYRDNMIEAFGQGVAKVIKSISIEKLIESSHQTFVKTVRELADKSYGFIKSEIGLEKPLGKKDQIHNPNLSVRHISALCDFVTKDKIIDLKVTNYIDERYIKQVLAYHYLSTKRNDLDIKQVIVYDATSGKHIRIDIQRK